MVKVSLGRNDSRGRPEGNDHPKTNPKWLPSVTVSNLSPSRSIKKSEGGTMKLEGRDCNRHVQSCLFYLLPRPLLIPL